MRFVYFFIAFSLLKTTIINGQDYNEGNLENCPDDTVLIINGKYLCAEKILLNREDILTTDSIFINKKELSLNSYIASSFSLGNSLNIKSNGALIPNELKQAIASKEIAYKFIYLKNILLIDNKNNLVNSTFEEIKISFID